MTSPSATRGSLNSGENTLQRKADISIIFEGGDDQAYSTHDTISGHVTLEHKNDAIVTELTITLEGVSATHVGNTSSDTGPASGKAKGSHHLLKLQHPTFTSNLIENAIEDGRSRVEIPFAFVVPERMLPGVCSHKATHGGVKVAHLMLPPTLEDNHYAEGVQIAKISYAVRVLASLQTPSTGTRQTYSRSVGVHIVPTQEEQPPLGLYADQNEYCLRRKTPIRSTFRKVQGELTAETVQPPCLYVDAQAAGSNMVSTSVVLTFVPSKGDEQTPEITEVITKLLEYTFYGASPFEELPWPGKAYDKAMLQRCYIEDFQLSARKLGNVSWTKHIGNASNMPSNIDPGSPVPGSTHYKASVLVPLAIPQIQTAKGVKKFTPSFHSCLVSRTHAIEFEIQIKGNASLVLKIPTQLVAKNNLQGPNLPTLPTAVLVDVDRVFSFGSQDTVPNYEEMPSQSATEQMHVPETPSQAEQLPEYASDGNLTSGQASGAAANRQSVSTTYEVPEQEWQNLWTGIKWVYGKAKTVQQRRASKSSN